MAEIVVLGVGFAGEIGLLGAIEDGDQVAFFDVEPLGMSLVSVMGPPCPQICGTRTLEAWTAWTIPVTRISRLARARRPGSSAA